MSDVRISSVGNPTLVQSIKPATQAERGAGFGETLHQALGSVSGLQRAADESIQDFSMGRTRDVAGTLIAVEKANLGFQLALQIRNRLLEAYQEVMRMSV